MRQIRFLSSFLALSAALAGNLAHADPALRKQVDQRGDFKVIGNVLGHECAEGVAPAPLFGSVACTGSNNTSDTAPDIFWRADWPNPGDVTANASVTMQQARSTAILELPTGATVTYARIYWAGLVANANAADDDVLLERPSASFSQTITADDQFTAPSSGETWYQSTADVTTHVQALGAGAYRVGGVTTANIVGLNDDDPIASWALVVFYERSTEPTRNLALFDGLDRVPRGGSTEVVINGFLVPSNAGFDAKLGVIAYEGEQQYSGDTLSFQGSLLGNALNPETNFFNGTRSFLGARGTVSGDLPYLTGGEGSLAGMDIDVVDVEHLLQAGQRQATIRASSASSNGDTYVLGAFITSISTLSPNFATSQKTFTDVNGGTLLPGDLVEYTITVRNTGTDTSLGTVITDPLPAGVTYVPGSLRIVSGLPAASALTDAAGDDVGEYVASTNEIMVRVGTGATSAVGGSLAVGQSTVVSFRVTVDADASGTILNQAVVTARGQKGAPENDFPTDGNGDADGAPPTAIVVDTDPDGDGLPTGTENDIGTDPNDADSDDDGVPDGDEPSFDDDTDGDGLINALDPDSDDDGLFDGTELGKDCSGAGTAPGSSSCIPDADPNTTTDPLDADTDDGGVRDGAEDANHNGKIDEGETDPNDGSDDSSVQDSDGDGLSDEEEEHIGSDPNDADSDDDGASDGEEANPADDTDGDGLINVLDPDSDNDGLYDGTELGFDCDGEGTDRAANHCVPDGDGGGTVTSPVNPDTDSGGVSDGNEDRDLDGEIDSGETDPTLGHGDDDFPPTDSDGDGLSDDLEDTIGTDPNDADSDDDGVIDGDEPNFADDTDGDGLINALDPDSDDDGLFDGTEVGEACGENDTDPAALQCIADADGGSTTTSPLDPDTDDGGVPDGTEDGNHDGAIDPGEGDPNDPSDDQSIVSPPGGDAGAGGGGAGGEGGAGGGSPGGGSPGSTGGNSGAGAEGTVGGAGGEAGSDGGNLSGDGGMSGDAGAGALGGTGGGSPGVAGNLGAGALAGNDATAGSDGAAGSAEDRVVLEGGGCSCRVAADADPVKGAGHFAALLGLLGIAGLRRQRRSRTPG